MSTISENAIPTCGELMSYLQSEHMQTMNDINLTDNISTNFTKTILNNNKASSFILLYTIHSKKNAMGKITRTFVKSGYLTEYQITENLTPTYYNIDFAINNIDCYISVGLTKTLDGTVIILHITPNIPDEIANSTSPKYTVYLNVKTILLS